jgi:hypothetical protein
MPLDVGKLDSQCPQHRSHWPVTTGTGAFSSVLALVHEALQRAMVVCHMQKPAARGVVCVPEEVGADSIP